MMPQGVSLQICGIRMFSLHGQFDENEKRKERKKQRRESKKERGEKKQDKDFT
jgi:hypothetical protein